MLIIAKIDLSVIVPVYNQKEKYLVELFDSIISQNTENTEIILILDGCNDATKELCYKYKKQDNRFIIYEQKNKGEGASRNKGIELAKGSWITFIDADDWVEKNYFKSIFDIIKKEKNIDIIIFDCLVEYRDKQIENTFYPKYGILDSNDVHEIQLQNIGKGETKYFPDECSVSVVWAKVYKKDFIINNNLKFIEGIKRTPDAIFNIYAFEFAKNILHCDIYKYHYRINDNSITQNYDENLINDINVFLDMVNSYINKFNKDKRFRNTFYIAVLTKLIQIYEIYIDNKKIDKLKDFINTKKYDEYIKYLYCIPKNKINLYQKFMIRSIINKNIVMASFWSRIKKLIKTIDNKKRMI